jgi:tetratricopeptide (TPR) repeat protein
MKAWLAALALAGAVAWPPPASGGASSPVLVLPFEPDSSAPHLYWMGEGAAVLLTSVLEGLGEPVIWREERRRAFERLQLPVPAALTSATAIRIGQLVGAGSVVFGTLAQSGDRLLVRVRVFDLDHGGMSTTMADGELGAVFELFERLGRSIADAGRDRELRRGVLPPSPAAFEQYVKGLVAEAPAQQVGHLEQALRGTPEFDAARLALWDVHTAGERHLQALEAVAPIGLFGPAGQEGRFRAAVSRLHLGRHDEAFAGFDSLVRDTAAPAAFNALGIVQIRRGTRSPAPATYYFNQAAQADPDEADYRFNLGYAYWLDGDAAAAVHWLRETVRVDPGDADAHLLLGSALRAMGADAEGAREQELARRLSERHERANGTIPPALERLVTRLAPGRPRVDTLLMQSAQRDQAELSAFHREAGRRAFEREDDRGAIRELRRALYLQPYDAEAHLLLGRAYLRGGQLADAIDALRISLWSEESADAYLALGEAYLVRRELDEAGEALARARELDPEHPELPAIEARLEDARRPG